MRSLLPERILRPCQALTLNPSPPHLPNENGVPCGPRAGPVFLVPPSTGARWAGHAQVQDREELGDSNQHQMRPLIGEACSGHGSRCKRLQV